MDKLKNLLGQWLNKYKYAILIVVVGVALMLLPGKTESNQVNNHNEALPVQTESMESRIQAILESIYGAGKVNVLLTVANGEETLFQENTDNQISGNSEVSRTDTVLTTDSQRNETGLIRQVNPPRYLGAVIVCQGADDPTVRLAVVDAVSKATGLSTDKISVLKMK